VDICSDGTITAFPGNFQENFLAKSAQMTSKFEDEGSRSKVNLPGDEFCLVFETARTKGRALNVQALVKNGHQVDGINHGP
jgi:hypothetical protein